MKILRTDQIRQADQATMFRQGLASHELMERASLRCVEWLRTHYQLPGSDRSFMVVCGPGNNGGDGLVIARQLRLMGCGVKAKVVHEADTFSSDNRRNQRRAEAAGVAFIAELPDQLDAHTVVIDAIFGSGFMGTAQGAFADAIHQINRWGREVVSVDVPSGLDGDRLGEPEGPVVLATHTLVFQCPRRAFMHPQSGHFVGSWHVLDIGLDTEFIDGCASGETAITRQVVLQLLPGRRAPFSHKGTYGTALLAGGSAGMQGAAMLAGWAALASGAGKVRVHACAGGICPLPELMTSVDDNADHITDVPFRNGYSAVGFGPGAGTHDDTARALKRLIQDCTVPVVLDADALNILAENPTWLPFLKPGTILTPHPGEFQRLVGRCFTDEEVMDKAHDLSRRSNSIVVLKGHHTVVITPTGEARYNTSGNPYMATAGAGDVLTGVITSLLAQGMNPTAAAIAGVWLHGAAGDLALLQAGAGITASELVKNLPAALAMVI
jgi:NAD(P)H-hydrate epimerase